MQNLSFPNYREQRWRDFTGRPDWPLDLEAVRARVRGKRILITGAGGFIASALVRTLAGLGASQLTLLDLSELGLYQIEQELNSTRCPAAIRAVTGGVEDIALVRELLDLDRPHIVFHAAACKHVPLMERNPIRAATTNIIGTQNVVEAASAFGAEQCILLSTDKAVIPTSVMGATKRVAEQVALSTSTATQMKVLRLGNVLGSSGSVVPLFLDQISRGGPVTVTHPEATRYFLCIEEAVHHLLSVLATERNGALLVPELGPQHRIYDLALFLIASHAPHAVTPSIIFSGLRPGDKLAETMRSETEVVAEVFTNGLRLLGSSALSTSAVATCLEHVREAVQKRDLALLLETVQAAVRDYRPSHVLAEQVRAHTERSSG